VNDKAVAQTRLPEPVAPEEDGLDGLLTPEFRVINTGNRRRGVRLERLFWQVLADIALARGIRRSQLVSDILDEAGPGADNTASVLRVYATRELELQRRSLVARGEPSFVINLLQAAPVPAFAINRQKRLQQVNPDFIHLLRVVSGNMAQKISADVVHMSLDIPLDQIFAQFSEGTPTLQCGYTLTIDNKQRRGRAKVVSVPPSPSNMLVGYIIS
jgi:predicted DNA-binding ribbon-helix-helix protein